MDPTWRHLPPHEQKSGKQELLATIEGFGRRMLLRSYTLVGIRPDVDFLFWQVAETPDVFQEFATAVINTALGPYLTTPYSYLSMTRRTIYDIPDQPDEDLQRLIIEPTDAKYLFVYPFVKTRAWYRVSMAERQRMMDEHIEIGRRYPSVKLNTTYSFGLDDQEFVVAFETDNPSDFLDLVMDLRESEASNYTLRDTPIFTCIAMGLQDTLDTVGGPRVEEGSQAMASRSPDGWVEAARLDELLPGDRRVVYLDGEQVALFNVEGTVYALSNRCTHARGPLSAGIVEGGVVTCPWHGARFDIRSGEVLSPPAQQRVLAYRTRVDGEKIYVRLRSFESDRES